MYVHVPSSRESSLHMRLTEHRKHHSPLVSLGHIKSLVIGGVNPESVPSIVDDSMIG